MLKRNSNSPITPILSILTLLVVVVTTRAVLTAKLGKTANQRTSIEIEQELRVNPENTEFLEVQFICQAPLETAQNWIYHEESCEEAAVLMTYLYETDSTITKEAADEEILKMIEWQVQNFGEHRDIYADDVKEFITGYLELEEDQIEIIYNASMDDIRSQIDMGHPVIVPITGEILKNPYYPHPGYHMLVVKGYTATQIITNDNGTRHGKDFKYDNEIFEAAINDAGGDILILNLE